MATTARLSNRALLALFLAASSFGSANAVRAADAPAPRKFYVNASLGGTYIADTTLESPNLFSNYFPVGEQVTFDIGRRLDVGLGYQIKDWLAAELELGVTYNSMTMKDGPTTFLGFKENSDLYQFPILANAVFCLPTNSRFKPFIGAGAGSVVTHLSGGSLLDGSDDDVGLAWQGLAGVNYQLSSRLQLGLVYKYLGVGERSFGSINATLGATQTHSLSLSVSFKF